jgi:hypothetical protein
MKSWLPAAGLAIALPLAIACSSDSNATPVSPEVVGLEAATTELSNGAPVSPETDGLQSATAEASTWTQVCHLRPSTRDGDWEFVIRRVQPGAVLRHFWHGDVKNECSDAMAIGDDCYSCAVR